MICIRKIWRSSTKNVHVNIFHIDDEMVAPIHNSEENYLRAQFFTMSISTVYLFLTFSSIWQGCLFRCWYYYLYRYRWALQHRTGDNMFASVPRYMSIRFIKPLQVYIKECQGIFPPEKYINNGVILFNMKAFRDKEIVDKFYSLIESIISIISILIKLIWMRFADKIYHLPLRMWDAMPNEHMMKLKS